MASVAKHKLFHLSDLEFDPILHHGYRIVQEPEPDFLKLQQAIMKSDHLVLIYPVWWMNCPVLGLTVFFCREPCTVSKLAPTAGNAV